MEAAMAAAHYKTTNLITFVDRNKFSVDGPTEKVMGLEPFTDKWKSFGFIVKEVDGHSYEALSKSIEEAQVEKTAPVLIMAHTIKGKGVDFMENNLSWHYGGLDSDKLEEAKRFVDRTEIG